jgi:hypothetical protein
MSGVLNLDSHKFAEVAIFRGALKTRSGNYLRDLRGLRLLLSGFSQSKPFRLARARDGNLHVHHFWEGDGLPAASGLAALEFTKRLVEAALERVFIA